MALSDEKFNSLESSIMAEAPARPMFGDYGLANHRGHLTHTFRLANPAAFDIKSTVLNGLRGT